MKWSYHLQTKLLVKILAMSRLDTEGDWLINNLKIQMRRYQIFSLLKSLTLKWKAIVFKKLYNVET